MALPSSPRLPTAAPAAPVGRALAFGSCGGPVRFLIAGLVSVMVVSRAETLDLGEGVSLEVIPISAGTFRQGSPDNEPGRGSDESQREVTLTRGFSMGKHPVTRRQFARFVAATGYRTESERGTSGGFGWDGGALTQRREFNWRNPGFPQGDDHPVTLVTYDDARAFCEWLTRQARRRFTLPTEAEWEYACRAGTVTAWHNGNDPATAAAIAWHKSNSGNQTHPVAAAGPNPWGLIMGGNVAEWCQDWYGPYPAGSAVDPIQTVQSLSDKPRRVLRGGSWLRDPVHTRSAARHRNTPGSRNADNGFRVVGREPLAAAVPAATPPAVPGPTPTPTPAPSPAVPAPRQSQADVPLAEPQAPPADSRASEADGTRVSPRPAPRAAAPLPPPPRETSSGVLGMVLGSGGIGLILCPLVGIGGLGGIIFLLLRRTLAASESGDATSVPALTPQPQGPVDVEQILPSHTSIRRVGDGFWLAPTAAELGSVIHYLYRVHGQVHEDRVVFQPGDQGQFIFTGVQPEDVQILGIETAGEAGEVPSRGSVSGSRRMGSGRTTSPGTSTSSHRYPNAY